jgi:hypothetical protein
MVIELQLSYGGSSQISEAIRRAPGWAGGVWGGAELPQFIEQRINV